MTREIQPLPFLPPLAVALMAALIPGAALLISFLVSASYEFIPWCFPLFEGCTSISRAARHGHSLYIFRMLMVPAAMLQLLFWCYLVLWFEQFSAVPKSSVRRLFFIALLAVAFLIIYANFLGTEGAVYTFMRRSGIYVYFACAVGSWLILTALLHSIREQERQTFRLMLLVCVLLAVWTAAQGYIKLFVDDHRAIENVIEWNIAVVMQLPFLVFAWRWGRG